MTVRVIVDAISLISIRLILLHVSGKTPSRAENNMTFNSHLQRFNNFAAKTLLLFYFKRYFNQIIPSCSQYCCASKHEPLFLISIYFRFHLTLCPAKRGLFYIPNFKINFLQIKKKN